MLGDATREQVTFKLQMARWVARARLALARRGGDEARIAVCADAVGEVESHIDDIERPGDRVLLLQARVGLAPVDRDLVWFAVAVAHDPLVRGLTDEVAGTRGRRGGALSTFVEVAGLSEDAGHELALRLAIGHPLLELNLMQTSDPAVAGASLLPAPRLVRHLLGDDQADTGMKRVEIDPALRREFVYDVSQAVILAAMAEIFSERTDVLLVLEGPANSGRSSAVAFAAGRPCIALDMSRLGARGLVGPGLAALTREVALSGGVPLLSDLTIDRSPGADSIAPLTDFIDRTAGPVAVTASVGMVDFGVGRPVVRLRWRVPETEVRHQLWRRWLEEGDVGDDELTQIALRYRLGPGAIQRAVASARATRRGPERERLPAPAVIAGVRHNIAEGLAGLATRVEVTQRWDDLVLAEDTMEQVQALVSRVRHAPRVLDNWGYRQKLARGTGVAALFSGPPGTGKTMVAGLLAHELDLELYQVDLSQVISKWIGETEKQLAKIFDAAEAGHALLLFDEADALFGQRSADAKQAVDRYANLEVNFLLQRIESFGGITVLTTNLDAAIDRALKRRLAGHIVFALPDEDERALLWQRLATTGKAPLGNSVDFDELAQRFAAMTGANIRNASISAAFLAAAEGAEQIEQSHLLRAGRSEYRSMGHMLSDGPRGRL